MQQLPLRPAIVHLGVIDVSILVPDPEAIQQRFRQEQAAGKISAAPYWSRVWHSARALSKYILGHSGEVTGRSVLEMAAGVGLPGLIAARFASSVTLSDYLPEAVAVLDENIRHHQLTNAAARLIDWNSLPGDLSPDLLLLSDVNYEPGSFPAVESMLRFFLGQGTEIWLATPQRLMAKPFIDALAPWIRGQHTIMLDEADISILLLKA